MRTECWKLRPYERKCILMMSSGKTIVYAYQVDDPQLKVCSCKKLPKLKHQYLLSFVPLFTSMCFVTLVIDVFNEWIIKSFFSSDMVRFLN